MALRGPRRSDARWYLFDPAFDAVTVADPSTESEVVVEALWAEYVPLAGIVARNHMDPVVIMVP